jgi:hypothetical protein
MRAAASDEQLAHQLPLMKVTPYSNKGRIMKKASQLFIAGAAAALLPLAAAFAQTPPPSTPEQPPEAPSSQQGQGATFESLDTNSDGKISKTEAEANATVKAQFSSYDLNGDGFIERDEVTKSNGARSEPPRQ